MAIHSSTIAWKIPWTEEPVGYSPWDHRESDMTEQIHFHDDRSRNCFTGRILIKCLWKKVSKRSSNPTSYFFVGGRQKQIKSLDKKYLADQRLECMSNEFNSVSFLPWLISILFLYYVCIYHVSLYL